MGEELLVEDFDGFGWEEAGAGGGAKDRVEDHRDSGGGLIPCR
jgi:hypothetical protein